MSSLRIFTSFFKNVFLYLYLYFVANQFNTLWMLFPLPRLGSARDDVSKGKKQQMQFLICYSIIFSPLCICNQQNEVVEEGAQQQKQKWFDLSVMATTIKCLKSNNKQEKLLIQLWSLQHRREREKGAEWRDEARTGDCKKVKRKIIMSRSE
jgi:hypothetical protein